MFITRKHLSRRTFLRGAGVAVGLPLLDAMVPSLTALAQTAAAPKPRLGFRRSVESEIVMVPVRSLDTKKIAPPPSRALLSSISTPSSRRVKKLPSR